MTQAQLMQQGMAAPYGICERCGAPKAPMILAGGITGNFCTRCTSAEDQEAMRQAIEMAKRYNECIISIRPQSGKTFWRRFVAFFQFWQ